MFKSCFSVSLNSSLFDRSVLRVTRALICSCSFLYYRTLKHVPLKTRQPLLSSRLLLYALYYSKYVKSVSIAWIDVVVSKPLSNDNHRNHDVLYIQAKPVEHRAYQH